MLCSAADLPEALLCAGKRHRRSRASRANSAPMSRNIRTGNVMRERGASQGPRARLPAGEALAPVFESCAAVEAAVLALSYKRSLKKAQEISESAPTTAPPSAEPSPVLSLLKSDAVDDAEVAFTLPSPAWPSVHEAVIGWDFCQKDLQAADDSDLAVWSKVPEAAQKVSKQTEPDWCILTAPEPATNAPKPSYADLLRGQSAAAPPAAGVRAPRIRRRRGKLIGAGALTQNVANAKAAEPSASPADKVDEEPIDDELLPAEFTRWHGWKKEHKASRNTKLKRKVDEQRSRRLAQSWTSRGWACEEDQEA
mmetsp:Transcript_22610/g.39774  ORF Transcript_22610/g.39774 Transcript_22610/m.39774 type:complete len:310 (-) Transcript_22610:160-1089(-)